MERGKLLQDRQSDVNSLKKELEKQDAQMKSIIDDFNKKQDLVDSNLRVSEVGFTRPIWKPTRLHCCMWVADPK